ncbi:MAG TPA: helix-turn-helix domain-containing protein [Acholeplasmataceae bacterium]|nr:helix-turn-helix domain-containing protein [Acholeplasmataceae bacterium]
MRATEKKILLAATKLFSESGYSGVSTRKIAEAAGVNELTLFRIFKSKRC